MSLLKDRRYTVYTDQNDVQWRIDRKNPDAKMVKLLDPRFVQGRVTTPRGLDYAATSIIALIVLLVGVLVGSAV